MNTLERWCCLSLSSSVMLKKKSSMYILSSSNVLTKWAGEYSSVVKHLHNVPEALNSGGVAFFPSSTWLIKNPSKKLRFLFFLMITRKYYIVRNIGENNLPNLTPYVGSLCSCSCISIYSFVSYPYVYIYECVFIYSL